MAQQLGFFKFDFNPYDYEYKKYLKDQVYQDTSPLFCVPPYGYQNFEFANYHKKQQQALESLNKKSQYIKKAYTDGPFTQAEQVDKEEDLWTAFFQQNNQMGAGLDIFNDIYENIQINQIDQEEEQVQILNWWEIKDQKQERLELFTEEEAQQALEKDRILYGLGFVHNQEEQFNNMLEFEANYQQNIRQQNQNHKFNTDENSNSERGQEFRNNKKLKSALKHSSIDTQKKDQVAKQISSRTLEEDERQNILQNLLIQSFSRKLNLPCQDNQNLATKKAFQRSNQRNLSKFRHDDVVEINSTGTFESESEFGQEVKSPRSPYIPKDKNIEEFDLKKRERKRQDKTIKKNVRFALDEEQTAEETPQKVISAKSARKTLRSQQ
ncbi:UNKNOWN [Stylonychia lemnae]|uniref:Uncharacterized protein n=1 Tax=Stylonychia lemnae TaxID=5949 RepID=A0A078BAN3_STYLE|nr:UNKNOWN [Stylonychia lemnae]|eukprot:CDW90628.1 UNKNOWN [Stylonychia lemnae]